MLPSVKKLVDDVASILANPKRELIKKGLEETTKASADKAKDLVRPIHQRISAFKRQQPVINNQDIATVAAVAHILYVDMLRVEINGLPLNRKAPDGYMQGFPAAFLFVPESVDFADASLDKKMNYLKSMHTMFNDVMPGLIASIAMGSYLDLKGLASSFSSLVIADAIIVKQALKTCENGVSVAEKGLRWAAEYDKTIDQFQQARAR